MTDFTAVKNTLRSLHIETPSWAYGNSGTRFKVFAQPGAATDPFGKIADAATVNRFTGCVPTVALHIPWDRVDDYGDLASFAAEQGIGIGAINANTFQDEDYRLGSVCNPDPRIRRKATDHLLECVEIAELIGSRHLTLWFADGTNYAGQDSITARQERLATALAETYAAMPEASRCCSSTRSSSPPSIRPICPTGARACCTASGSANAHRCWSIPVTTRRAPTSR